jgi:hypothetical protein
MAEKPPTEEELREYYQARKGDVSTWAKKPRTMRRKRGDGPSTTFAIRLTPQEIKELQSAAELHEVSLSEFIRATALKGARAGAKVTRTRAHLPTAASA